MVKRCIAAGCANTYKHGVGLFGFPQEAKLRDQWTREVKKTRDQWKGPSQHSVICSDHFTDESFESGTHLEAQFGLLKRRRLRPDAVPTIFKKPADLLLTKRAGSCKDSELPAAKRRERAHEKRERSRVS